MDKKKSRFSQISRDNDTRTLDIVESILIICEGEKTEPNYFKEFPVYNLKVEVDGRGSNTLDLVQYAIKKKNEQDYDSIWCVFDKDSFPDTNFNEACLLASNNGIELAYSVESFELWYLLHFEYLNSGINRKLYISKLNKLFIEHFSKPYKKNSEEIYHLLTSDRQQNAIKLAKRLSKQYPDSIQPASRYPVTYVHSLVEKLNQYLKENRWEANLDEALESYRKNMISLISNQREEIHILEEYKQRLTDATSKEKIDEIVFDFFIK